MGETATVAQASAAVAFVLLASCSGDVLVGACGQRSTQGALAEHREPIYGGDADASYLAVSDAQVAAVVRLDVVLAAGREAICTGALVARDIVLTAKHCVESLEAGDLAVRLPDGAGMRPAGVLDVSVHSELDLAIIKLAWASPPILNVEPLSIATEVDGAWIGRRAVLAGYGENEEDTESRLLFATEAISEMDELTLTTAGRGLSGACVGDSGGALLARDVSGRLVVLGILTSGSPSCRGNDSFVRLDGLQPWLEDHGVVPMEGGGCGLLSERGRCFDGQPVWCEDDELRTDTCGPGRACGYDAERGIYRCIDSREGCAGADEFGACLGDQLVVCAEAEERVEDCAPCGHCGFDSRTGKASCSAP